MIKKHQHTTSVRYFRNARGNAEDKAIGFGCIMLSAGMSFSMIAWLIHLVADRGFPML